MELHFSIWVLLEKVSDLLFRWRNWVGKHSSDIWDIVLFYLMWTLWEECNSHTFDDMKRWTQLIELFVGLLFDLSRAGVFYY